MLENDIEPLITYILECNRTRNISSEWIGRSQIHWPGRVPDLNPLDFFFGP